MRLGIHHLARVHQRWRRRFGTGSFAAGPGDGWFVGKIMVVLD